MTAISAVQARTVELQGLIESLTCGGAVSQVTTTAPASTSSAQDTSEFSTALSQALAASSAASPTAAASVSSTAQVGADGNITIGGLSLAEFANAQVTPGSGMELIQRGMKYLGTPYVWGGSSPSGFDCSGFTSYVLKEMGVTVPRTARQQGTVGTEVPSLEQARPGDLLILNGGTHVGIYIGADQYMHAPRPGEQVKIGKIYGDIDTIRRVVPAGEVLTGGTPNVGTPATLAAATTATTQSYGSTLATDAALGRALLNSLVGSGQATTVNTAALSGLSGLSVLGGQSGLSGLTGLSANDLAGLANLTGLSGVTGTAGLNGLSGLSGLSGITGTGTSGSSLNSLSTLVALGGSL